MPDSGSVSSDIPEKQSSRPSGRLLSLDALRGFNMFWIMGADEVFKEIAKRINNPSVTWVTNIFCEHVEWVGFRYHDMIFPLFLFIIGVAIPFSFAKLLEKGATKREIAFKIIKRTLIMIALGFFYYKVLDLKGWEHQRMMGVLQRLALGYGFAAMIALFCNVRTQIIAGVSLLVGYWLTMRFIPVPGYGAGNFTEWGNFANYMDRLIFLPGQLYQKYGDPEGLYSTIPAISTCLMGVLAGHWLRTDRDGNTKAKWLMVAGVAAIALGYLWGIDFPVIKKIWTSSYVLVAGGWSLLILGAFYWTIDVKGWKRWTPFFVVIGLNPITIYVGDRFIDFEATATFFVKGLMKHTGSYTTLVFAISVFMARWLFLKFLDNHKIYFKV